MEKLDQLERGFDDIEHRIANMDKEHTRYVRATVTRLNYLLNQEDNMKGLVVQLLNHLSEYDCPQEDVSSSWGQDEPVPGKYFIGTIPVQKAQDKDGF